MQPHPTNNKTRTLAPDLNRGMTTGMDRMDVNAHLDSTGNGYGTNQGLMRSMGEIMEPAKLVWKLERKANGKFNKNDKLTLEQSAQTIDKRIHKDSESTQRTKTTTIFRLPKADENDDGVLPNERREDQKWEKKEKPDSADEIAATSLTQPATENSTPSPHSQRTIITLTSDGHETLPENPATELDTNQYPIL